MDYDTQNNIKIEEYLKENSIWNHLQNTETLPALMYQWNRSTSYKLLLTALSIDSKNVFYGPRWSSEVPRFAANLQFTPLVPKKAESATDNSLKLSNDEVQPSVNTDLQDYVSEGQSQNLNVVYASSSEDKNSDHVSSENGKVDATDVYVTPSWLGDEFLFENDSYKQKQKRYEVFDILPDLSVLESDYIVLPNEIM